MESNRNDPTPTGLVIARDLMFTSKVTGTAEAIGHKMRTAADIGSARTLIERWNPAVIVVDLTAGDPAAPEALAEYRRLAGDSARLIAVGPHVDADRLAAAKAAGCQLALPRSKFSAELPALLRGWFAESATEAGHPPSVPGAEDDPASSPATGDGR